MTPTDLNDARLIALTGSLVEGLSAKALLAFQPAEEVS
jgi:hypothetical protein